MKLIVLYDRLKLYIYQYYKYRVHRQNENAEQAKIKQ